MTTKFEYDVSGKDMKEQRNTLKFIACTAEHCERYEDMAHYMALLVKLSVQDGVDLSVEERNLLSVAYKSK